MNTAAPTITEPLRREAERLYERAKEARTDAAIHDATEFYRQYLEALGPDELDAAFEAMRRLREMGQWTPRT